MSRDLNALTVREIKEELAALGVNYEGCVERSDLIRKLQETQEARGQTPANKDNGVAGFMNAMQGSFANMTDSFAGMMKNVSDRFDKMEGKLDGLESQREQLRAKLGTPSQTALGRLNQLKASAGAREVESKLAETKDQCREERERMKEEVAKATGAGAALGL